MNDNEQALLLPSQKPKRLERPERSTDSSKALIVAAICLLTLAILTAGFALFIILSANQHAAYVALSSFLEKSHIIAMNTIASPLSMEELFSNQSPVLTVSPSQLNNVNMGCSQNASTTWTCRVTLSNQSPSSVGQINWSVDQYTPVTVSPSSGTLDVGEQQSVTISDLACTNEIITFAAAAASGSTKEFSVSWTCTPSPTKTPTARATVSETPTRTVMVTPTPTATATKTPTSVVIPTRPPPVMPTPLDHTKSNGPSKRVDPQGSPFYASTLVVYLLALIIVIASITLVIIIRTSHIFGS
jgi:hypothetical protein